MSLLLRFRQPLRDYVLDKKVITDWTYNLKTLGITTRREVVQKLLGYLTT